MDVYLFGDVNAIQMFHTLGMLKPKPLAPQQKKEKETHCK